MSGQRTPQKPMEEMTLRDKCREVDRLSRELEDHLQQGFVPKVHELRKLCKPQEADFGGIPDITIRSQIQQVLASERYTGEIYEALERGLVLIAEDVNGLLERDHATS